MDTVKNEDLRKLGLRFENVGDQLYQRKVPKSNWNDLDTFKECYKYVRNKNNKRTRKHRPRKRNDFVEIKLVLGDRKK